MTEKILVVEDDSAILTGLLDLLSGEGYQVFSAQDGEKALTEYALRKPDLVLLDVMIPGKSGYDVCKEIRKKDPLTPIIMLTAKGQEVDKVVGLEIGADDYIVKPFGVNELLARVRAVLRRNKLKLKKEFRLSLEFGDVFIDLKTMIGKKKDNEFNLSMREVDLLQFFMEHEGEVMDRALLLDEIWGITYEGTTRTLDQHIAKLRRKIENDPSQPRHILTVHGVGYKFVSNPE